MHVELFCRFFFRFVSIASIRSLSMQRLKTDCQPNGITKIAFYFSLRLRLSLSLFLSLFRTCIRTAHTAHGCNYRKRVELPSNSNRIDNFPTQYY